jgi:hypothetical protein
MIKRLRALFFLIRTAQYCFLTLGYLTDDSKVKTFQRPKDLEESILIVLSFQINS